MAVTMRRHCCATVQFLAVLLVIHHGSNALVSPSPSRQATKVAFVDSEKVVEYSTEKFQGAEESRRSVLGILATTTFLLGLDFPTEAIAADPSVGVDPSTEFLDSELLALAVDWRAILTKASKKALGGGKAGAAAAVVQVCSLMWMRTAMNYQYRYGGDLGSSLKTLWAEGGIPRLYQGLPFALLQGPLTRFGDTAANVGILSLLDSLTATSGLPLPLKTAAGSAAAGAFRILLMPIDTSKTAMQVEGADGLQRLWAKVLKEGPSPLYQGALASAAATAAGHFPWFLTYNALDAQLPVVTASDDLLLSLVRSAALGLCASCVSDCVSNSLRVIKTTKQTAGLGDGDNDSGTKTELTYPEIVAMIIETDGVAGLLGRGLQTRLLTNAIQGGVFSVLWRYFQQVGGPQ
ncbi:mitochondrial carrier protein [Fragilaria crotonensis]|nr:mitochondrial carrier protein [Fragilaria crotonensis]